MLCISYVRLNVELAYCTVTGEKVDQPRIEGYLSLGTESEQKLTKGLEEM